MKYLQTETYLGEAESADDAVHSSKLLELRVSELRQQLEAVDQQAALEDRLRLSMDLCYALLEMNHKAEAWSIARESLDQAVSAEIWLRAVEACDIMFQSEQVGALKALAHGIWLGVTFPIDPELSVAMLQHLVDESPDRSDGAAVAAATACYLVDMRAKDKQREDLYFFTNQLLGQVARRHSQVEEQEIFDFWVQQLELNDPEKFLPRLGKVLDLLIEDEWWFDRERLRRKIPD